MIRAPAVASLLLLSAFTAPTLADEIAVTSTPVTSFQGVDIGGKAGGLIWRGGLTLTSPSDIFGGLSGIGFVDNEGHLVMVSDHGNFVSGQLIYDSRSQPLSLVGVSTSAIQNSKGADLPRAYARDSEGLSVIEKNGVATGVRIGFENLTRVSDYALKDKLPGGPAREITIPAWLSNTRTNETLEAVCIAPPLPRLRDRPCCCPKTSPTPTAIMRPGYWAKPTPDR